MMDNKPFLLFSCFFIALALQISNGLFGWLAFGLIAVSFLLDMLSLKILFKLPPALIALGTGLALKNFGMPGYLKSMVLTYFALFIFGKQAFANYYYFLTFLQAVTIFFFTLPLKSDYILPQDE